MAKGFGVSPITKNIYYGTQNKQKHLFTGNKEDVTDEAIAAVFEWFVLNYEDEIKKNPESKSWRVTYLSSDYELVLMKKSLDMINIDRISDGLIKQCKELEK